MACKSANAGIKAIKSYEFDDSASVRQKLRELMVKNSYREQLMGQIETLKDLDRN